MELPIKWHSILSVCKRWNCDTFDIMHLAETDQLSLFINWHKLEERYFPSEFYFVERKGFARNVGGKSDFLDDLHFSGSDDFDIANRDKCHPYSKSPLRCLGYLSSHVVKLLSDKEVVGLEGYKLSEIRDGRRYQIDEYSINTGIFMGDYELICRLRDKDSISIGISDLVITVEELARFECIQKNESKFEQPLNKPNSLIELINKDDTPNSLYFAYTLFEEAWKDLPANMKKPTKPQLSEHLKTKGITETTVIDSIIKVSTPNNVTLGGKQKPELSEWKPKNERN